MCGLLRGVMCGANPAPAKRFNSIEAPVSTALKTCNARETAGPVQHLPKGSTPSRIPLAMLVRPAMLVSPQAPSLPKTPRGTQICPV